MRVRVSRSIRYGSVGLLAAVLALAACTGPQLPGPLGGSGTQSAPYVISWQLSLARPISGIPTTYTMVHGVSGSRDTVCSGLCIEALGTDPGTPEAAPGSLPFIQFSIPTYGGPNTYHVDGKTSYVEVTSGTSANDSGSGHGWSSATGSTCTFTVISDEPGPQVARRPSDRVVKGTFSCQNLQPGVAGDPVADIQSGKFTVAY